MMVFAESISLTALLWFSISVSSGNLRFTYAVPFICSDLLGTSSTTSFTILHIAFLFSKHLLMKLFAFRMCASNKLGMLSMHGVYVSVSPKKVCISIGDKCDSRITYSNDVANFLTYSDRSRYFILCCNSGAKPAALETTSSCNSERRNAFA